jgi:Ca2+-binding EF-hand superfamily protein
MKASVMVVIAFTALPLMGDSRVLLAAGELQGQRQRSNMRFQGLDTDGDGRITRSEWRGNDRSFRNHDWNNDGVLSGDEVRFGALRQRDTFPSDDRRFYDWSVQGFRSLDVNGDNRVTRREWPHDYEQFLRADRNRDNVLTRAEFLASDQTDLDQEDRFADLDTNENGRIDRAEWHGTVDVFEWLDRNNDGTLTREETVENDAPTGTSGRTPLSGVVVVNPQTRWTSTAIEVREGDVLEVQARGTIWMSGSQEGDDLASPAGAHSGRRDPNVPLPDRPVGALIGRIGDSEPFYIGDGTTLGRVPASGRLFLSVNDSDLGNNGGRFRVTITVR